MTDSPVSVGELTRYLQDLFSDDEMLSDLWIEGEVAESFTSKAGHTFFSFADEDARLRCVMFRASAARQTYLPAVGQSCAAHGSVSIYAKEGQYQLYADFIRPAGIGLAALELELLKQQLQAEGLFEPSRKRPLPERIRTIGLVTSAEGAVRHDVETVIRRRNPFTHLILSPAAVQGDSAPESLRLALGRLLNDGRSDVIIIGRGGGSATDLAAFNDGALVRAVFASPIPIVSAVGHETDWTLLDLVADLRAPTPSAAAELCTEPVAPALRAAGTGLLRSRSTFNRVLSDRMLQVSGIREMLGRVGPAAKVARLNERVKLLNATLDQGAQTALHVRSDRLGWAGNALQTGISAQLTSLTQRQRTAAGLLGVLDPGATLARGYAAITDAATELPVFSIAGLQTGHRLRARLRDGTVVTSVTSVDQE